MNKILLCMVVFLSLVAVPISYAGGFETKIVFVPDKSKSELQSAVRESMEKQWKGLFLDQAMANIDASIFDINELTRGGWEIKSVRRAWKDFNNSGSPDYYEWGKEYTLQKKNKGWW